MNELMKKHKAAVAQVPQLWRPSCGPPPLPPVQPLLCRRRILRVGWGLGICLQRSLHPNAFTPFSRLLGTWLR